MSALTDLFTALANKIRSKTGGSATYTPPQMVNAIDDVYAAGAASVTVTSITPSNTSPVFIEIGSAYKPSKKGYAIESYDNSVTQSAMANGAYFPSGMVKMPIAGYAYSSRPQMTETTLWTNSNPTSSFANQTVTLSQSITAFDYIRIYFRTQNTQDNEFSAIYLASEVNTWVESSSTPRPFGILCGNQGTNTRKRLVMYVSNTSLSLSHATGVNNSTTVDAALIPTKITGLKL